MLPRTDTEHCAPTRIVEEPVKGMLGTIPAEPSGAVCSVHCWIQPQFLDVCLAQCSDSVCMLMNEAERQADRGSMICPFYSLWEFLSIREVEVRRD